MRTVGMVVGLMLMSVASFSIGVISVSAGWLSIAALEPDATAAPDAIPTYASVAATDSLPSTPVSIPTREEAPRAPAPTDSEDGAAATDVDPPADTFAGVVAQESRTFRQGHLRLVGLVALQVAVGEFDTEDQAKAVMPEFADRLRSDPTFAEFQETSAPTYADETRAYSGDLGDDQITSAVTVLVVRDGRYVHIWSAASLGLDSMTDILEVADKVFVDRDEQPDALVERLPTLSDVPSGMVLESEPPDTTAPTSMPPSTANGEDDPATRAVHASAGRGSRNNPVPMGIAADVGDWTVTIIDVVPQATDVVLAENQFNDPPATGRQYVLISVEATHQGDDANSFYGAVTWKAVGESAVAYHRGSADRCGVIPDDITERSEVFQGGMVQGNICFSVHAEDVASLMLYLEPLFSFDADERIFFALQ